MAQSETLKEFLVKLGVDPDTEALAKWDAGVQKTRRHMQNLAQAGSVVVAGISAVGGALVANTVQTSEYATEVLNTADALNIAADRFQALNLAAKAYGADGAADTRDLLSVINDRAEDAVEGTQNFVNEFERLNIQSEELEGLSPYQRLLRVAEGMREVSKQQASIASERILGGELGQRFLPFLQKGRRGVERLMGRFRALGVVMDRSMLEKARNFQTSWNFLLTMLNAFRKRLGAALADDLKDLVDQLIAWIQANEELIDQRIKQFAEDAGAAFEQFGDIVQWLDGVAQDWFGGWVPMLKTIIALSATLFGLWATGQMLGALQGIYWATQGAALKLATMAREAYRAHKAMVALGKGAGGAGSLLTPLAALAVALGGVYWLIKEIYDYTQGEESFLGPILDGTGSVITALTELGAILAMIAGGLATIAWWVGAVSVGAAALSAGLVVAAGVAVAAIIAYWDEIVWAVTAGWNAMVAAGGSAIDAIVGFFYWLGGEIKGVWDGILNYVDWVIDQMIGWAMDAGQAIAEYLGFGGGDINVNGRPPRGPGGGGAAAAVAQGRPRATARSGSGGSQVNVQHKSDITVQSRPGDDEEEIARRVDEKRREDERKRNRKVAEKLVRGNEQ